MAGTEASNQIPKLRGRRGAESRTTDLYLRLRDDILVGVFPFDQRLLETALAARYQVSRTPVREALVALEHEGLIEHGLQGGPGFRVRTGTAEDVMNIYEARVPLEPAAAASAATRRTDFDLARLDLLHRATQQPASERDGHEANSAWHRGLWAAAHNDIIAGALNRWLAQLRIYDQGPPRSANDLEISFTEHEAVMQAIRDSDPERAKTAMAAHLQRSLTQRLEALA